MAWFDKARARADAQRLQRERQQGLGKPIISVDFKGRRLVAVKNHLLHSKSWLTFQCFRGLRTKLDQPPVPPHRLFRTVLAVKGPLRRARPPRP